MISTYTVTDLHEHYITAVKNSNESKTTGKVGEYVRPLTPPEFQEWLWKRHPSGFYGLDNMNGQMRSRFGVTQPSDRLRPMPGTINWIYEGGHPKELFEAFFDSNPGIKKFIESEGDDEQRRLTRCKEYQFTDFGPLNDNLEWLPVQWQNKPSDSMNFDPILDVEPAVSSNLFFRDIIKRTKLATFNSHDDTRSDTRKRTLAELM